MPKVYANILWHPYFSQCESPTMTSLSRQFPLRILSEVTSAIEYDKLNTRTSLTQARTSSQVKVKLKQPQARFPSPQYETRGEKRKEKSEKTRNSPYVFGVGDRNQSRRIVPSSPGRVLHSVWTVLVWLLGNKIPRCHLQHKPSSERRNGGISRVPASRLSARPALGSVAKASIKNIRSRVSPHFAHRYHIGTRNRGQMRSSFDKVVKRMHRLHEANCDGAGVIPQSHER